MRRLLLAVWIAALAFPAAAAASPAVDATRPYSYLAPSADRGPASVVAAVKTAVPALIAADTAVGRLPTRITDRQGPTEARRRAALIQATWAPWRVAAQREEWDEAIAELVDDPTYLPFTDNRLVVREWQGVTVHGSRAFAKFLGYEEYRGNAAWRSDEPNQYQVYLAYSSGAWRLDAFGSVFPAPEE
jgi:hypothetical protein